MTSGRVDIDLPMELLKVRIRQPGERANNSIKNYLAGSACSRTAAKSSLRIFMAGLSVSEESVRLITASA